MRAAAEPDLAALLDAGLLALGLDLSFAQRVALLDYVALLVKWNKTYNLTAVRDPERMIGLHILDSLAVLPALDKLPCGSLLDVGTGAGLPGIPLAIARPALRVTMLDVIEKKTTFVRQCIGELKLSNADVVTQRVEACSPPQPFDAVISRAFASIGDFIAGAAHLTVANGKLLAMKGLVPHDELKALPASHRVDQIIRLNVRQVDGDRHLVILSRVSP